MTTHTSTITNTTKHNSNNNNNNNNNPQRLKRIELVITPGKSLGPFRLGSSLWDTIQLLRDRPQFFPTVELKYSQKDPLRHDFIISLPSNGIHLRYDGSLQRLKSIECFDPSKVKLVYQNGDVSSSRTIPTFLLIYKSFGPTYPGEFDAAKSIYTLKYPGLAFTFPIPLRFQTLYQSSSDLPMEFPDGTTPIASRVYLYTGSTHWQQATVPSLSKVIAEHNASISTKYGKLGRRELETIIAKPTKGATLYFPTQVSSNETTDSAREPVKTTSNTVQITLHLSTAQDILADLGKPSRIFYKEEDKMKIHSTANDLTALEKQDTKGDRSKASGSNNGSRAVSAEEEDKDPFTVHPTDYFFNYFHLGIDILIDGGLHVCKKIVLHGNIPGHYDFQRYKRCPFQIVFSKKDVKQANGKENSNNVLVDVESDTDDNDPVPVHIVTAEMKAATMQKRIPWKSNDVSNANEQKPVILTRGSSEQNPFGSTHLTGYDEGIVMEVTKNGYVPTIVLY
ncbi:hypothetical protein J3Q64DRAFT_1756588 [Phycomyces blakesleeanus]|uniref:Uncharacterized protein n=2 Tax=Phycomyces blakesleeanus TaxID=4837 RepID=A0A167JTM5_PHYB8|nr:hypothetical protein PHYBLDRAFT_183788 [Phycomyces blakesleeanus NRRL 1555(-)]OAD66687.1 hypothetical protein PHYBLDRAFT_183788 [Phycomyces blakesleeanus NRRL 1555(-)]|eukprot:XP_018284727.1 hypothetical protein PHYBLDRAFT_183788 [Phycomyces blakesleeanus NRRL 1555(-)]